MMGLMKIFIYFILVCLVSFSVEGQRECQGIKDNITQQNCIDGVDATANYRKLAEALPDGLDTVRIYEDLLEEFDTEPCKKSCTPAGKKVKKGACTEESLVCTDDPCHGKGKELLDCLQNKKPGEPGRKKRAFSINEKNWFRCDFPVLSCCKTCRRTIPMITPLCIKYKPSKPGRKVKKKKCLQYVYPVFCPRRRGFQLIDHIVCLQQNCRKKCNIETTFYSFLVTLQPYDEWHGHCPDVTKPVWLVVWFKTVEVDSHCTCPREGSLRPKKP